MVSSPVIYGIKYWLFTSGFYFPKKKKDQQSITTHAMLINCELRFATVHNGRETTKSCLMATWLLALTLDHTFPVHHFPCIFSSCSNFTIYRPGARTPPEQEPLMTLPSVKLLQKCIWTRSVMFIYIQVLLRNRYNGSWYSLFQSKAIKHSLLFKTTLLTQLRAYCRNEGY